MPKLFRVLLEVADLGKATAFYCKLLDQKGRRVGGGRHYYDCGPVIVGLVDVAPGKKEVKTSPTRPLLDHAAFIPGLL
jgi:hypothetical protein